MEVKSHQSPGAALSKDLGRLVSSYMGHGPTKAHTTIDANVAVVTLAGTLTKAERNLVSAGEREAVVASRRKLQQLMRDEAVAVAEALFDRKVESFLGDIDPESDVAVMVFMLEPGGRMEAAFEAEQSLRARADHRGELRVAEEPGSGEGPGAA